MLAGWLAPITLMDVMVRSPVQLMCGSSLSSRHGQTTHIETGKTRSIIFAFMIVHKSQSETPSRALTPVVGVFPGPSLGRKGN